MQVREDNEVNALGRDPSVGERAGEKAATAAEPGGCHLAHFSPLAGIDEDRAPGGTNHERRELGGNRVAIDPAVAREVGGIESPEGAPEGQVQLAIHEGVNGYRPERQRLHAASYIRGDVAGDCLPR